MSDTRKALRCAVYTRKSSEEGLEQAFNSLDAQREACEAYIQSQRHEGWKLLTTKYDDGGFSGGSLDRPAVTRLLADIDEGRIDVVVVYKVDRLTRSLSDFARIVERFDAHVVSFVSVTQQFNTTSSMGRLTLNVLLSFAQFEREVTGERIRDKIAASKRKGMWMGGTVALGYDARERKLVVNPEEAKLVLWIYRRYLELGCVSKVKAELDAQGGRSKARVSQTGRASGGASFSRGALYTLLHNRLYLGEISHRGKSFRGDHESIIPVDLWQAVQVRLRDSNDSRRNGKQAADPSLLAGLIYDDRDNRLTPSHAIKNGKRYRYYVSQALIQHRHAAASSARRIPAHDLEGVICRRLTAFLTTNTEVLAHLGTPEDTGSFQQSLIDAAKARASTLAGASSAVIREFLRRTVSRIVVGDKTVRIFVLRAALRGLLQDTDSPARTQTQPIDASELFELNAVTQLRRSGGVVRLILPATVDTASPTSRNVPLIRAVVHARCWYERLVSGDLKSQPDFAKDLGISARYVRKIYRCAFLAPDIVEQILAGRQSVELTLEKLLENLPLDWAAQRRVLGFSAG